VKKKSNSSDTGASCHIIKIFKGGNESVDYLQKSIARAVAEKKYF